MNIISRIGCLFYAVATALIAIQQMFYGDFCPIFFPPWPNPIVGYKVIAYLFSVVLLVVSIMIIRGKNIGIPALLLGSLLLLMLFLGQVPWQYLVFPHKKTHLGVWILPLKELAWAGGAFCIAGIWFPNHNAKVKHRLIGSLEKLIPYGPIFFAITMTLFGICHFLYTNGIADMVPSWIPGHLFWAYFSGAALICAGISIMIGLWPKQASMLLGIMILIWFIILHLPNAIKYPFVDKGQAVFSTLSALAFSGIAFIISGQLNNKKSN